MPFEYRALTANCGNDSIGTLATNEITQLLQGAKSLDFIVINCQEVDFGKTQRQLEEAIKKGYKVTCLGKMVTHTKPSTQFHSGTGMATFVIHKEDILIQVEQSKEVRRKNSRFSGSGYNKGGVITDFVVSKKIDETIEELRVQAISGHLDSTSTNKRNLDWHNLHKAKTTQAVHTWPDLIKACPSLIISGYDANTRNKLEEGREVNLLVERPDDPEIQALSRAAFGGRQFSIAITYDKTKDQIEDLKRPGYSSRGMLDYLAILDGSSNLDLTVGEAASFGLEDSTARDHHILISPPQAYAKPDTEFKQVRDHIASRLEPVAPQLAAKLRALTGTDSDQLVLITTYNKYLSRSGLLNKAIELHNQKLAVYTHLTNTSFTQSPELKNHLKEVLFAKVHWCEGSPKMIAAQQSLMHALVDSLKHCNYEEGIIKRLNWHKKLQSELELGLGENQEQSPKLNATEMFKKFTLDDYIKTRENFAQTLANYNPGKDDPRGQKFKQAGANILNKLDAIQADKSPCFSNYKTLDLLTRVALESEKACTMVSKNSEYDPQILTSLSELAEATGKKSSPLWKALCLALNGLITLVAKIFCIPLEKLIDKTKTQEDKLLNAVTVYKSSLQDIFDNSSKPENDNGIDPQISI